MDSKVAAALGKVAVDNSAIDFPDFGETSRADFPLVSTWLIIGHPKSGKSKLAEHLSRYFLEITGKPLFHMDIESGAHQVSGAKKQIDSLGKLDRYIQGLENGGKHKYSGFILDPTDSLAEWCDQLTCTELKIAGIGSAEYGKDYVLSRNHFMKRMMRLKTLGKTLVLVAHTKQEKRDEKSQTRPNLTGQLSEMVMGQSDSIAYLAIEKQKGSRKRGEESPDTLQRVLSFAGNEGLCAGSRYEALSGRTFELQDLNHGFNGNLWLPVLDAFKLSEESQSVNQLQTEENVNDSTVAPV